MNPTRAIAVSKPRGQEIITGVPESLLMGNHACSPHPATLEGCRNTPIFTPDSALGGEGETEAQKKWGAWEARRQGRRWEFGSGPPDSCPLRDDSGQGLRLSPGALICRVRMTMASVGQRVCESAYPRAWP